MICTPVTIWKQSPSDYLRQQINKDHDTNFQKQMHRVSDPHWFNADPDTDPDPEFYLIADPDSGSGSRVWWSKIEKNLLLEILFLFSRSKIAIYLSLGLHKGRPSYRRSLQPSKENIQHFKRWKFCPFFNFFGSFLPSWIRIRIRNLYADPDPAAQINADPCGPGYGSGFETLQMHKFPKDVWYAAV